MALFGICSIRPAPNTGVGMRKTTLCLASSVAKSTSAIEQPGASGRSAMVNKAWTAPSGVPSVLCTNRATRTGPSGETNVGKLPARFTRLNLASAI
jgi:hypothetical protein